MEAVHNFTNEVILMIIVGSQSEISNTREIPR